MEYRGLIEAVGKLFDCRSYGYCYDWDTRSQDAKIAFTVNIHATSGELQLHKNFFPKLFAEFPEYNFGLVVLLVKCDFFKYLTNRFETGNYANHRPKPPVDFEDMFKRGWYISSDMERAFKEYDLETQLENYSNTSCYLREHTIGSRTSNLAVHALVRIGHHLWAGRKLNPEIVSRTLTVSIPDKIDKIYYDVDRFLALYGKFEFTIRYGTLNKSIHFVYKMNEYPTPNLVEVRELWDKMEKYRKGEYMPRGIRVDRDSYSYDNNIYRLEDFEKLIRQFKAAVSEEGVETLLEVYASLPKGSSHSIQNAFWKDLLANYKTIAPKFMSKEKAEETLSAEGEKRREERAEEERRREERYRERERERRANAEFSAYCRSMSGNHYCRAPKIEDDEEISDKDPEVADLVDDDDDDNFEKYLTPVEKARMDAGQPRNIFHCGMVFVCTWNLQLTSVSQYITDVFDVIENGWHIYPNVHDQFYMEDELTGDKGCSLEEFLKIKGYDESDFIDKWLALVCPSYALTHSVENMPEAKLFLSSTFNSWPDAWVGILPEDKARIPREEVMLSFKNAIYVRGVQHDALYRNQGYTQKLRIGTEQDILNYYKYCKEHPSTHTMQYGD
jgi:hypothetical protein